MGGLQAVAFVAALCATGCESKSNALPAPTKRREAVLASQTQPQPTAAATATATSTQGTRKQSVICSGPALDRDMPTQPLGHAEAAGERPLGTAIETGGSWTWVNLWAAWCGPCKEELPRLFAWQQQLKGSMRFAFVSLDDDQRQLLRFLEAQPKGGLRSSYWLPEGKARDAWLGALRIKSSPELPIQILIDPQGRVQCIVEGAVEDTDLPRVKALLARGK